MNRFSKRIKISDITNIGLEIRSIRLGSWKQIIISDNQNQQTDFTMNMYDHEVLHGILVFICNRNNGITLDDSVSEIALQGTTQIAEEVHGADDLIVGKIHL